MTPSIAGKFGNAANFTAASSQKLYYAGDILPAGTGSFSVAVWVKQAGNVYQPAFWNGDLGGSVEYATIYLDDTGGGRGGFWVFDGTTYTSGQITGLGATNQWWLLVGVYDATEKQAYVSVNGSALTATAGPNAGVRSTGGTVSQLGHSPVSGQYATNNQDQLVIWNRPLVAGDVTELWNAGAGKAYGSFSVSLATGATHAYTLDESSTGNTTVDRADAVDSNTLSDVAGVASAAGKNSLAANFVNASHQYLIKTSLTNRASFSLSAWFYVPAVPVPPEGVFQIGAGNYNNTRLCAYLGGGGVISIEAWSDGGNSLTANIPISADAWHFIVGTYDGVAKKAGYSIDGAALVLGSAETSPITIDRIIIGSISTGNFWYNSKIDEVGWWSRVLVDDEITALFNAGAGKFYPY